MRKLAYPLPTKHRLNLQTNQQYLCPIHLFQQILISFKNDIYTDSFLKHIYAFKNICLMIFNIMLQYYLHSRSMGSL